MSHVPNPQFTAATSSSCCYDNSTFWMNAGFAWVPALHPTKWLKKVKASIALGLSLAVEYHCPRR